MYFSVSFKIITVCGVRIVLTRTYLVFEATRNHRIFVPRPNSCELAKIVVGRLAREP